MKKRFWMRFLLFLAFVALGGILFRMYEEQKFAVPYPINVLVFMLCSTPALIAFTWLTQCRSKELQDQENKEQQERV